MKKTGESQAYLFALGAVALWSTVAVAFKLALKEISPLDLVALAVFFSWLSLGAVLLFRRNPFFQQNHQIRFPETSVTKQSILYSALLGLVTPLAYYWILFAAYDRLPAQAAQPLNYTWPLFLALLAVPITGRKPTGRDLLGLLISFAGVVLIARRPEGSPEILDPTGIVLALGSGLIWAFSWLVGIRIRIDGTLRLFTGFSSALLVLAVFRLKRGGSLPSSLTGWAAVFWVGLFEMGITFLLWNGALERTRRPARIGNLIYLGPFISLFWIALILGEHIRPATVTGLAVIVSGILIGRGRTAE